eukprot:COSAG01_NODE_690_length_14219_cov_19.783144_5_plen_97_part_00
MGRLDLLSSNGNTKGVRTRAPTRGKFGCEQLRTPRVQLSRDIQCGRAVLDTKHGLKMTVAFECLDEQVCARLPYGIADDIQRMIHSRSSLYRYCSG